MPPRAGVSGLSRRDLIKTGALAAGVAAGLPVRTAAPQPRSVPRNRTLTLAWIGSREGRWVDFELWNPYAIGANHQNGLGILYEPLAYYSAFGDREYPWLAESFRYILVNPGAGIAPGVVVVLTVLSFYRVGDALRDKLAVGE